MAAVTATRRVDVGFVTATRVIRPPDPKLGGDTGLRIGPYSSAEAVRILAHCFIAHYIIAHCRAAAAGSLKPGRAGRA